VVVRVPRMTGNVEDTEGVDSIASEPTSESPQTGYILQQGRASPSKWWYSDELYVEDAVTLMHR